MYLVAVSSMIFLSFVLLDCSLFLHPRCLSRGYRRCSLLLSSLQSLLFFSLKMLFVVIDVVVKIGVRVGAVASKAAVS